MITRKPESVHNAGAPVHMIDKHGAGSIPLDSRRLDQVSCPYIIEVHQKDKHQHILWELFALWPQKSLIKQKNAHGTKLILPAKMKPQLIGRPGPKPHQKGTAVHRIMAPSTAIKSRISRDFLADIKASIRKV